MRDFLEETGYGDVPRRRMEGDASTRIFERLVVDGTDKVLMNAPRRPDGPPVRDGKPYSAIAHLAEDVIPYVALAQGLRDRNLSAPTILQADLDHGLIIMEDLGNERIVAGDPPAPIAERYEVAVDLLVSLHRRKLPERLPVVPHREYRIPYYDIDAFLIEAELLLDWYLPSAEAEVADGVREEFIALWREALQPAIDAPATWVLRDFHSPNLLWLPDRESVARIGLLDFQDALIGPAAYDVASLLQDARVDVPEVARGGAAQPLCAGAALRSALRRGRRSRGFTRRSRRSGRPKSSASSPGSTAATASRNISVISPAYCAICSDRWRIRIWRRSRPGMPPICRHKTLPERRRIRRLIQRGLCCGRIRPMRRSAGGDHDAEPRDRIGGRPGHAHAAV